MLIPDSAHGTNPASAAIAGFDAVSHQEQRQAAWSISTICKSKLDDRTAVFMITNPNTLGLFESQIGEITELLHERGALVYLDGANMNAILGITRPGDFGADMMHYNVHKTFTGPHGAGGPGSGPIAVRAMLAPYLPAPMVVKDGEQFKLDYDRPKSIGRVRSFFGNVGILLRGYCYIRTLGPGGLARSERERGAERQLSARPRQGRATRCRTATAACTSSSPAPAKLQARRKRISAMDIAKRLLDFGYPRADGLLPAGGAGGDDDRADRDGEQGDARRVRRDAAEDHRGRRRIPARRAAHDADQPAGRCARRPRSRCCGGKREAVEQVVRLLPYADADGATNMAADETLVRSAAEGTASLRFYGWTPATLSLGYFQSSAIRHADSRLAGLPFVRRPSGGATLVHHHEVTYALALPAGFPWQTRDSWVLRMHRIIAAALAELGENCQFVGAAPIKHGDVLCFQQFTCGDVLCGGKKIVGSAQRKYRQALMQHGSILLAQSEYTPDLPGIRELTGVTLEPVTVVSAIRQAFAEATGWRIEESDWTESEKKTITELANEKYATSAWNQKR